MSEMVHITFGNTVIAVRRDLVLPTDPSLHTQLEAKLFEYRNRLKDTNITAHREASTNYKIWVLQQLLDQNSLDFLVLKAAVARDATNQTLAIAYLAYAWKVIENYCYNRGSQNRGGTGLPTPQAAAVAVQEAAAQPEESRYTPALPGDPRPVVAVPMQDRATTSRPSRLPFTVESEADIPVGQHVPA
jgi:hypothetical protein